MRWKFWEREKEKPKSLTPEDYREMIAAKYQAEVDKRHEDAVEEVLTKLARGKVKIVNNGDVIVHVTADVDEERVRRMLINQGYNVTKACHIGFESDHRKAYTFRF